MLSAVIANVATTLYVGYGALDQADPASSSGSIETFLQYGVLGLVVVGFLTGWIVPGPQAKQLLAENQRLTALLEEKVIPLSSTYSATMERSNAALEKAASAMEAMIDHMDRDQGKKPGRSG